jgi:DNA mismatch repair ATPase MutS
MDFIVKLSKSKDPMTGIEYDSILTVVKQIIKYGYFIPFRESINAPKTAHIVIRIIIANHGLS